MEKSIIAFFVLFLAGHCFCIKLHGNGGTNDDISSVPGANLNLAVCETNICKNDGRCVMDLDDEEPYCLCRAGWGGRICETASCLISPCKNGGTCEEDYPRSEVSCRCPDGWRGETCESADACTENPCQYGGTCYASEDFTDFVCECHPGFTGKDCSIILNPCETNHCGYQESCIQYGDDYMCTCKDGSIKRECGAKSDPCIPNPCLNGGSCESSSESYRCSCGARYSGSRCESDNALVILAFVNLSPRADEKPKKDEIVQNFAPEGTLAQNNYLNASIFLQLFGKRREDVEKLLRN